tara:strand:- start:126 stop:308 length:183 start_codon:yes stop_codon:yes gene_type:complete
MGQSAVTVEIIERLIVKVFCVLVIFFIEKVATFRKFAVATVATEVKLAIEFINLMTFMTY